MVTICQQCGDIGFSNALVYCVECLQFAVHRYCLYNLPETFDEFVHWVCEDCEPKVPNQSALNKPGSIPSQNRDHTSLKHVEVHSGTKLKKRDTTCLAAETEEHRCQGGSSQQFPEVHTKPYSECARLTGDGSPLKLKLKKKKDVIHSVAEANKLRHQSSPSQKPKEVQRELDIDHVPLKLRLKEKKDITCSVAEANKLRHQSSPSHRPGEAHRELDLIDNVQLASDSSQKVKKKKDVTSSVSENEEQRLQSIPSQQHQEAYAKMELTERGRLASDFTPLKIKLKWKKDDTYLVAKTEEQKCRSRSSQPPHDADTKIDLTVHSKLEHNCSTLKVKLNKKIKDVTCSVAEIEEQRLQTCSRKQSCVAITRQGSTKDVVLARDCSPMNGETSIPLGIEKHGKDLELEKESRLMPKNGSNFDDEVSQLAIGATDSQEDYHVNAKPIIDPIWRGNFIILDKNYDTFNGFVAHLSSQACQKVYEEASLFPSSLCLEMLPKSDVWPKSFQTSEPSDGSIALYFFPADARCERGFDHLVDEMMCQELAMKATVKNADLLVFTSRELPRLYWRFQGKYYLWGVFIVKQVSKSLSVNRDDGAVHLVSANYEGTGEERNLTMTKTSNARSPLSPLSNSGSYGSGA